MKLYKLKNKLVLRVKNKACEFLKGFTSNDLDKPKNAFLDVHGKIVATFDQQVVNDDEVLIVIEGQFLERLKKHLEKYLFLSGTTLEEEAWNVYVDLEGEGRVLLMKENLPSQVSDEEFTLFRLRHKMPEQGIDYDEEMLLNVSEDECVSYTKGCFLGQEIIARVHHRSRPPKELVVRFEDACTPEERSRMTSLCRDPQTGRRLGFLFVAKAAAG